MITFNMEFNSQEIFKLAKKKLPEKEELSGSLRTEVTDRGKNQIEVKTAVRRKNTADVEDAGEQVSPAAASLVRNVK